MKIIRTVLVALALVALVATSAQAQTQPRRNSKACHLVDVSINLPRGSVTAYSAETNAFYAATTYSLMGAIEKAQSANFAMHLSAETRALYHARGICDAMGY